jgi:predicted nucleic acid-binding protein
MQRHFCGLVDASVVIDMLLRRGRTRNSTLQPLQQIQTCATIFHVISNYVTALWVGVSSSACRDDYSGLRVLNFTIAPMSKGYNNTL